MTDISIESVLARVRSELQDYTIQPGCECEDCILGRTLCAVEKLLVQQQAEMAELRKDKERLDWMENNYSTHTMPVTAGPLAQCQHAPEPCPHPEDHGVWTIFGADDGAYDGSTMRAAIDAAMKSESTE